MQIIWDETFVDTDGELKWCSRPKVVVPFGKNTRIALSQLKYPFVIVSKHPDPLTLENIQLRSSEILCQVPDEFFEKNNC